MRLRETAQIHSVLFSFPSILSSFLYSFFLLFFYFPSVRSLFFCAVGLLVSRVEIWSLTRIKIIAVGKAIVGDG